jgi:BMFP domain-containing protein YqiC
LWFDSIGEYQAAQHSLDLVKRERYENWKQVVTTPPDPEVPVVVDRLQAAYDALSAAEAATAVAREVLISLESPPEEG